MKKNKVYIVIIFINLFLFFAALGFSIFSNHNKGYIILSSSEVYYKDKHHITRYLDNINKEQDIIAITPSGSKKLTFQMINGKVEFYQNDELIEEDRILAFSPNLKLDPQNFIQEKLNEEDMKKVEDILKKHGIIGYENLNTKQKVSFDYDRDGTNETLYLVSNLFDETMYGQVFSFAYYIKDDEIIYLTEQVNQVENTYDLCVPFIHSIIDLDQDRSYELLLGCEYFDNIGVETKIYKWDRIHFKEWNQ